MGLMFCGIGVSRGIAIAPAYILHRDHLEVSSSELDKRKLGAEIRRFKAALSKARKQLQDIRDSIPEDAPADISAFIEAHLLMLDDTMLSERPIEIIKEQACNAEWALKLQREAITKVFETMDDPYIATRKDDVNHVIDRILRILVLGTGQKEEWSHDWSGQIVIADDLTPADTIVMQHQGVAGFVTETGGQLSHTAILARSLGVPAIVGVHNIRQYLRSGESLIIDGHSGMTLAEPDQQSVSFYRRQQRELKRKQRELIKLKTTQAVTRCGEHISLLANIEVDEDTKAMKRVNAAGVGLYRTEFLYMSRQDIPDEEEHFKAYSKIVRMLKGAPLTIRTVDLGGDKETEVTQQNLPLAHNPAMGLRGIRRCLTDNRLLVPQLRAILRASAKGPINIMFPMLTNIGEVDQVLALLESVKNSLRSQHYKFDEHIQVGGMIEVPAAAILAGAFAERLDFLSIGTNDLIQYTLAIDRTDDLVNYLYDPLHPSVLLLIKQTIEAGVKHKVPVTMCGEMAGDQRYTRLLLGLGLRHFSMPPNSILEVKEVLQNTDIKALKRKTSMILHCNEPKRQQDLLQKLNQL